MAPGEQQRSRAAIAIYLLLALALTSPRLLGSSLYIVDSWRDSEIFFWNFWWLKEALAAGSGPWFTRLVFYPAGTSLALHPTSFLNAAFSLPFQWLMGSERGVIVAFNWLTLGSLTLSAEFTRRLALRLGAGHLPAFLGGIIYSFSAFHFWHLGRLHVGGLEWLVLYVLVLVAFLEDEGKPLGWGLKLGGTAALILYTSLGHLMAAALLTAVLVAVALIRKPALAADGARRRAVAWAAAVMLLALLPFVHAWLAYPAPRHARRSLEENVFYAADAAGFVLPGDNHRIYGRVTQHLGSEARRAGREIFVGLLPLLVLPLAWWRGGWRRMLPWWVAGAVFMLLSLGPSLKILGWDTGLPLPYQPLYHLLPFLQANRTPVRFAAVLQLCVALLAASGLTVLLTARARLRRWLAASVVCLALADALLRPVLASRQPIPDIYKQLAAGPAGAVVLNVPLYHAVIERRIMYHQIFHGRPLTTACIPRASTTQHQLIEGTELRACLLEAAACARAEPETVAAEIRSRNIGDILLHTRSMTPELFHAVDGLLRQASPAERLEDPTGIVAFRFPPG